MEREEMRHIAWIDERGRWEDARTGEVVPDDEIPADLSLAPLKALLAKKP